MKEKTSGAPVKPIVTPSHAAPFRRVTPPVRLPSVPPAQIGFVKSSPVRRRTRPLASIVSRIGVPPPQQESITMNAVRVGQVSNE